MGNSEEFDVEANFKSYYSYIFSFFYLIQGIVQAIPAFLPFFMIYLFGEYDISLIALIAFIALLPWSFKFFVGMVNDKWGSDKYGRRFPFIISFGIMGGLVFVLMSFTLPLDESIYFYLILYLLLANIGMAVADTSLDGLILDVVPKKSLAKVQGYTWSMLMVGGAGAAGIGLLLLALDMVHLLFLITGISLVACCSFTILIKEPPLKSEVKIAKDLKRLLVEKKNWKIYAWTLITAMAYPMIIVAFFYLMLTSMGVVDISTSQLSLESGETSGSYLILTLLTAGASGLGIILGSILMGRIADKSRLSAIRLTYFIYLPLCLISSLLLGYVLGLAGHIAIGFVYGSITIVGQTIRGDIAKKNFPDLKSTYYALLISFSNLGQSFGNLFLSFIFREISPLISNFFLLYFLISLFCFIIILISFLIFKTIDPAEYEFEQIREEVKIVEP